MISVKKETKASNANQGDDSLALVLDEQPQSLAVAPIVSSYNEKICPILDAVENLRRLNIANCKEGIELPTPTIVVVGDQSSGKSSVLESLVGIGLPRCTRVPLIMRLQNYPDLPNPELVLEFNGQTISTDEAHVSDAINLATQEIAGSGKGISNIPLTLLVKKKGVPELTMVDLPGITRVPVHGQPENVYDQIKDIIMEYITPDDSIILNVLSATVDHFTTCECIRMSQTVDKTGLRTLAVITKADKSPEGLLEKLTADDFNIGLGNHVCVRNRIGDESFVEARMEELKLFENDTHLSKIDKSIVGFPVLAQKVVLVHAMIISMTLPEIVNQNLSTYNLSELEKLPSNFSSLADAMTTFMQIIVLSKDSLRKILLAEEIDMHCSPAHLVEMLDSNASYPTKDFLMEEMKVLQEAKLIGLPNFMLRSGLLAMLRSALHLMLSINDLIKTELEKENCHDSLSTNGCWIDKLFQESLSISENTPGKLSTSVQVPDSNGALKNIKPRPKRAVKIPKSLDDFDLGGAKNSRKR